MLLRHQPNPGGKIPSRSESLRISDAGDQSGGERGTNAGNLIEPPARLIGSVPGHDLAVKVENLHLKLIDEFDQWTESEYPPPRRKGALR